MGTNAVSRVCRLFPAAFSHFGRKRVCRAVVSVSRLFHDLIVRFKDQLGEHVMAIPTNLISAQISRQKHYEKAASG